MKTKLISSLSLVALPTVIGLPTLIGCSTNNSSVSYTVTEQEFIDAINLKDVQCIQRIQHTPSKTITWWMAPNICREVEEGPDSYVERYTIPKPDTTDTWITKKRTSKTEASWTTEENDKPTWYKTIDSDDVKPIKILRNMGDSVFDNYQNYTFESPINIYIASFWESTETIKLAELQFSNKKVTYLKTQSLSSKSSLGIKFEFTYDNVIPVFPQ